MTPGPRRLYRLVNNNPPTDADFFSNLARGRPPRGPEISRPELQTGISLFASLEAAAAQARRPGFVADLLIRENAQVRIEKTLGPDYFSVWGEPQLLRSFVVEIHPLQLPHG